MKAVISAGGKGSRFVEITKDQIPKPMAPLLGKPILQYTVETLKKNGVTEITFLVGHLWQKIEQYFGDGKKFGVKINYNVEEFPLGSGGALWFLKGKIDGDFVMANGDSLYEIDLNSMLDFHKQNGALITLLTQPTDHPHDSDLLIMDKQTKRVLGFNKKNEPRPPNFENLANVGFFIINSKALEYFKELKSLNLEHDFITHFINTTDKVFGYESNEYIKDVGTPERYAAAIKDLQNGFIGKK